MCLCVRLSSSHRTLTGNTAAYFRGMPSVSDDRFQGLRWFVCMHASVRALVLETSKYMYMYVAILAQNLMLFRGLVVET